MTSNSVIVFGTKWCPDSRRARSVFDKLKFPYEFIDVDSDSNAREKVKQINHGNCSVPTIIFPDGTILTEPDSMTLENKIISIKTTQ